MRAVVLPDEANAIFIINPNAVLAHAIVYERLQFIRRWRLQVGKRLCRMDHGELSKSDRLDMVELLRSSAVKDLFCILVGETLDHIVDCIT